MYMKCKKVFRKFYIVCLCLLVAFSCFLRPVYADDYPFSIYAPVPLQSTASNGSIAVGNNNTGDVPHIDWNTPVASGFIPTHYITSSIYDTGINGTMYLGWYYRSSNTSITVSLSDQNIIAESSSNSAATSSSFSSIPFTRLVTTSNNYGATGYNNSFTTVIRFDIPTNSHAWRVSSYGYQSTGTGTIDGIYFPVLYLAGWGNDVASKLDAILSQLVSNGASLNSILSALNNIYTQAVAIGADVSDIETILTSCASYLRTIEHDTDTISQYTNSINNYCSDIYSLLHDALGGQSEELSQQAQSVAQQIEQREDAERFYNDTLNDNLSDIDIGNFNFSSDVVNGITVVGSLFTALWNRFSGVTDVILFSLTLGVALVIIGRISSKQGKGGKHD